MESKDMVNCLHSVADYMSQREESPRCASDLRQIATTLQQLEKELAELRGNADIVKYSDNINKVVDANKSLAKQAKQLTKENAELKAKLENAIVPKFKVGQEVWILEGDYASPKPSIECLSAEKYKIVKVGVSYSLDNGTGYIHEPEFEQFIFASEAEAQASLKPEGAE
jgi:predicted nuclease with TOPRIM domain